jgi:hypothetical protein
VPNAPDIKVLLRNVAGQYLAGVEPPWQLTTNRSRAAVFDYHLDHVAERLQVLEKAFGTPWRAARLDPREAYETCDRCGARVMAFKAFFEGGEFLCADCRRQGGS